MAETGSSNEKIAEVTVSESSFDVRFVPPLSPHQLGVVTHPSYPIVGIQNGIAVKGSYGKSLKTFQIGFENERHTTHTTDKFIKFLTGRCAEIGYGVKEV